MKTEKLRQRMEILKTTEQGLSEELVALMEKKRLIQQDKTTKTKLKMKADRELFLLKFSSCSKVNKQEVPDDVSSLRHIKNEKKIKKEEGSMAKLKKKLKHIGKEERDLDERTQTTEMKLEENNKKLDVLRLDLESLGAFPASSASLIAVRIKALKSEGRERVDRFVYLEKHIILLNAKQVIDDIQQKKQEWLDCYDCDAA